jgi:hypothetical protein
MSARIVITIEGRAFDYAGDKCRALELAHVLTTELSTGGRHAAVEVSEHLPVVPVQAPPCAPEPDMEEPE